MQHTAISNICCAYSRQTQATQCITNVPIVVLPARYGLQRHGAIPLCLLRQEAVTAHRSLTACNQHRQSRRTICLSYFAPTDACCTSQLHTAHPETPHTCVHKHQACVRTARRQQTTSECARLRYLGSVNTAHFRTKSLLQHLLQKAFPQLDTHAM